MANSATTIVPMIGVAPHPLHSALEALLYLIPASHPRDETYTAYTNPHTDAQILTQWILCLYLRGMTPQLSEAHYKVRETIKAISTWIDRILEGKESVKIRDRYLKDFLQKPFKAKIDDLIGISSRLRVDQVIPISIVYLVVAMYTDQRYQMQNVTLFSLKVNENELMPIVLHPLREVNISLQSFQHTRPGETLWQLILGIEYFRSAEITLSEKIRLLGELAVPLCAQYNWNLLSASSRLITIQEVPVTNYCATLYRELYLTGWSDTLMSYSERRRVTTFQTLKQQMSYDIRSSIGCCRQKIAGNPSIVTAFFKTLLSYSDTGNGLGDTVENPLRRFLSNTFSRSVVGEATDASKPKAKADDNIEDTTSAPKDVSFRKSPQTEHQTEHPGDQTEAPVTPTKPDTPTSGTASAECSSFLIFSVASSPCSFAGFPLMIGIKFCATDPHTPVPIGILSDDRYLKLSPHTNSGVSTSPFFTNATIESYGTSLRSLIATNESVSSRLSEFPRSWLSSNSVCASCRADAIEDRKSM